ncbi:MAG: hypothetical protein JW991_01580 [Candidatus Pacebacteria bacterium]|nr:hypothetical protein [Candidatus Paceibacterota bacterium]
MAELTEASQHPDKLAEPTICSDELKVVDRVPPESLFPNPRSRLQVLRRDRPPAPDGIEGLSAEIPPELRQQEVTGEQIGTQAQALLQTPFLQAVRKASVDNPAFVVQKRIILATMQYLSRQPGNKNLCLPHGSPAGIELSHLMFARLWPPMNIYAILGPSYPAFHAQATGRVPESLADSEGLDKILEKHTPDSGHKLQPALPIVDGKLAGLYPLITADRKTLEPDAPWVSQDQIGRRQTADMMIEQIRSSARKDPEIPILVEDAAGGVGNMTELILKRIWDLPPEDQAELLRNTRFVVREYNEGQIVGGKSRFAALAKKHPEISRLTCFTQSDVTRPIADKEIAEMKAVFGDDFDPGKCRRLGMSTYTAGAMPSSILGSWADQIINHDFFVAVDFSNPDFASRNESLATTEYQRLLHGRGLPQVIKPFSLGIGLADHYHTVWPNELGHVAGYSLTDAGQLAKPNIITLGQSIQQSGGAVEIKSAVRLYSLTYAGEIKNDPDRVLLAAIPGWWSDQITYKKPKK